MQSITLRQAPGAPALEVSRIALGTARFGSRDGQETAFAYMDLYLEAGGNCIDTARSYGGGESEALVGRWLRQRGVRERVVLSTKGCHRAPDGSPRLTRAAMEEDLGASLEVLGTHRADIYWLHKDDPDTPVEEIVESAAAALDRERVCVLGCSNWHVDRIAAANAYAAKQGLRGFAASQIDWSLAYTEEELFAQYGAAIMNDAQYAWYLERGMPVFGFGAQGRGFFSKLDRLGLEGLDGETRRNYGFPENLARMERVRALAQEKDASVAQIVLGYLIFNKLPGVAVIGCSSQAQLRESLAAAGLAMSAQEADRLIRP